MAEFTQMLLASDAAVAPASGFDPPPLDPDPSRGTGDSPAGGAFDEIAMSEKGIDLLTNAAKEEDGTPPSPPTLSTYERMKEETGKFEEEKDANFLEDNWGKLLTVMAGTALQMVGVHNKNAPMFIGGNALSQLGGVAMADYYSTKENEQQALYDKYTKEGASPRDVAAVKELAQEHIERTGEVPSLEKLLGFISLYPSISKEQGDVLVKEIMDMGEKGPGVKQALGQLEVGVNRHMQEFRQEMGFRGALTESQMSSFEQYLFKKAAEGDPNLVGIRSTEGARALPDYIATASTQPISGSQLVELGLDQDEEHGLFSKASETLMKWAGFPASQATSVGQININNKVSNVTPVMEGISDLGSTDDVSKSTHITTYGKMATNLRKLMTVKDGKAVIPKGYGISSQGAGTSKLWPSGGFTSGGAYSAHPGAYKNVEYIQVLKDDVSAIGIDSSVDVAQKRLNVGLDGDENVFHPDFLAYIRQILQEGIVRQ